MNQVHTMEQIRTAGAEPMRAKPLPVNDRNDRLTATILAAEILAQAKVETATWAKFAWRIIDANVEVREALQAEIKKQQAAMTKGQVEFGIDKKMASKNTASFAVQVSRCRTIAKAFNSGATVEGLKDFINGQMPANKRAKTVEEVRDHTSFIMIYNYAATFTGGKGSKTTTSWLENVGKFLDRNPPAEDDTQGQAQQAEFIKLYNALVKMAG